MKYDVQKFEQFFKKKFEEKGYSGMAVTIRGPEGKIFEKGFGKRSISRDLAPDGDTVFGIASMSKSFTTLACAILQTEGKLNFSDPVCKYFPDFHIPGTPDECVTLRNLAMHNAGIPPIPPLEWSIAMNSIERDSEWYREMLRTAPNKMETIEEVIEYISKGDYRVIGAPGEYMSYSNEGYAILSYVVDKASGMTLEEFLKKRIFEPLGMTRTVLDLDGSEARELAGDNMTSLFERDDDGNLLEDDNWSVLPPFRGCACVKSTSSDVTRYYKMLSDKGVWEGKQVIPSEAVEILVGREFPERERPFYCFGLEKRLIDGKVVCEHTGGLHGVSTCGGFVEGGYSAAVLCNEGDLDVQDFQWVCYNLILGLPLETTHYWAEPSGGEFSSPGMLFGDFCSQEGMPAHFIVTMEDGRLKADLGWVKTELKYCYGSVFVACDEETGRRVRVVEFYIRDGRAWGVLCGNRIYQRVEE